MLLLISNLAIAQIHTYSLADCRVPLKVSVSRVHHEPWETSSARQNALPKIHYVRANSTLDEARVFLFRPEKGLPC
jgi:hypothetical protein